jgi:hypothetical protein
MAREPRSWSLDGARALLPDVRKRTASAVAAVQALLERRESEGDKALAAEQLDAQVGSVTSDWVRAMEALGLEVKGLWLVDFDNGSGYYCWRWPETELAHFHGYEEGFSGRVRIQ